MPKNFAIIVAGGSGSRMNNDLPKQFVPVNGKEIIIHTLDRFRQFDQDIQFLISAPREYLDLMDSLCRKYGYTNARICAGGETRFHSVKHALSMLIEEEGVVAVHDAARPTVSLDTIKRAFDTANEKGNATPVMKPGETIRELIAGNSHTVNRENYRIIQTPQCFRIPILKKAFQQDYSPEFTDDATVVEHSGERIHLVEGNAENIKVTWPKDLIIVKALLDAEQR